MRDIGAVILAAGGSTRFGTPKQFLKVEGETLIRRVANTAIDADCRHVVVVAGEHAERIGGELHGLRVEVIENAEWSRGLGTSIKRGVTHLVDTDAELGGIVIVACDQPFVSGQILQQLAAETQPIAASGYAGTVGIPALFRQKYFAALASLPDESGAKSLIDANRSDVAVVPFPEGAIDIDTPADYAAISRRSPS
jgi:molybdenum cofactor cytidylyltransferase